MTARAISSGTIPSTPIVGPPRSADSISEKDPAPNLMSDDEASSAESAHGSSNTVGSSLVDCGIEGESKEFSRPKSPKMVEKAGTSLDS